MAVTGKLYGNAIKQAFNKEIDFDTDVIKAQLHTSTYTPSDAHDYHNDLTNELTTALGYTVGGVTLGTKTVTYTVADSWGTARGNTTAYVAGDVYRPAAANTHLYQCTVAGTSAGSPPTFTTVSGADYADGTATFTEAGSGIFVVSSAAASWSLSGSITARYCILVDTTPGSTGTNPAVAYVDFGQNETGNTTFTVTPHATLGWFYVFSN